MPKLYGPETRKKIAELYRNGVPSEIISAQTGACVRMISTIAQQEGCTPRSPGGARHTLPRDLVIRAVARYERGDKVDLILSEEKISRKALLKYVEELGVERRKRRIDCCEVFEMRKRFSIADTAEILDCCKAGVQRASNRHRDLLAKGIPEAEHSEHYDRRGR